MHKLIDSCNSSLQAGLDMLPAEPLWKRVPTHDERGHPVSDFMMLIPRLRRQSETYIQKVIAELHSVLASYGDVVLYVDLNLKLNLLWVSVRPVPGICLELPAMIKMRVPEAMLVGQRMTND